MGWICGFLYIKNQLASDPKLHYNLGQTIESIFKVFEDFNYYFLLMKNRWEEIKKLQQNLAVII